MIQCHKRFNDTSFRALLVSNPPPWNGDSIPPRTSVTAHGVTDRKIMVITWSLIPHTAFISMEIMWRKKSEMIRLQVKQCGMYRTKWWNAYKEHGKETLPRISEIRKDKLYLEASVTAATNTVLTQPQEVFSPSQWWRWVSHSSRILHHVTGWLAQHPRRMTNSSPSSCKMPCINFLITTSQSRCNNLRKQNRFSWYLILRILTDTCQHSPIVVKIKCKQSCINLLKSSSFFMYHQVLMFKNSTWRSLCVECFVRISEQTATFALYITDWLVFITLVESVYCTVRTDSLYKADYVSSLKG